MSLMKLAPETVRLRRVAKAYAAGEFSRFEYRAARREVIENFRPDALSDDDTQRRSPAQTPQAPERGAGRARRHWLWLSVAFLLGVVLFAATAPAQGAATIVPVSERNPNPLASPRMPVTRTVVRDFTAYPGIEQADVEAVMAEALAEIRTRNAEKSHGFTGAELEEVGRLLNALGVHAEDRPLSAADAADLQSLIAEQKQRRGISVVELEEIAAAVQAYYRDAGYLLAVAYVPSQEVADGVVELAVLPGLLGEVVVTGADQELVASRFAGAMGEPVTEDAIAGRLYLLNQLPGVKAQAAFEPGAEVGETRLNLDVIQDRSWSARVLADNHGDPGTGEQRLGVYGSWLNPRGIGDVLEGGALQTLNPANQTYGFVEYTTPVGGVHEISARIANNAFTADAGPEVDGDGVLIDLSVSRALKRSRTRSVTATLGLHRHHFGWQETPDQTATFVSGALSSNRVFDQLQVAGGLRVSADVGRITSGTFVGQDATFWRLGAAASGWKPVHVPFVPGEQKLAARVSTQFSGSQLPSTLRMTLGGAQRARGYDRDVFLADAGLVLGVDLRFGLPLGELVLFTDAAYGESLNDDDEWGYVWNVGVGWDADLTRNLVTRLSLAAPIGTDGSTELDDDGAKLFWSLRYEY